MTKDFRAKLRRLGWSQADLARRLDVFPSTVTDWVNRDVVPGYAFAYLNLALDYHHIGVLVSETLKKTPRE